MPRRLFDSEYIFGLHEPGGEQLMIEAGHPGWVLFTEAIGRDPNNFSGKDFSPWSNRNLGVVCRINNGYYPDGTIPNSAFYADFARRCANYVANSPGCKIWIIGNEMNYDIERPPLITQALPSAAQAESTSASPDEAKSATGETLTRPMKDIVKAVLRGLTSGMGDAALFPTPATETPANAEAADDPYYYGSPQRFSALTAQSASPASVAAAASPQPVEVITPDLYVRCYRLCREAIRRVPGHADDQVIVGAVAPWNDQTKYPGNPNGDWVQYLQDILHLLGPTGCDGVALHTYTHGSDPNLIFDTATMNPPFQNRHYHFIAYRDFMAAIPADMRTLPVYMTETNQDVAWLDQNTGWVRNAYGEINWWNQQAGNQQIRSLILYRWPNIDRWVIETKPGVIADFRAALVNDYRWPTSSPPPNNGFTAGQVVETTDIVNLRRTPGYTNKPANDVLSQLPTATRLTVLSSTPGSADNLVWWNVRYAPQGQTAINGWAAQTSPSGQTLLRPVAPTPPPAGKFAIGDTVQTTTVVNLRHSPGYANKPPTDVIMALPSATLATVAGGPRSADSLTWWQLRGTVNGSGFDGWAADTAPGGQVLLERVAPAPASSSQAPARDMVAAAAPAATFRIGDTFATRTIVRLRRTPGITNKPANDVIADIAQGVRGTVTGGPQSVDSLTWWQTAVPTPSGPATGWMAEVAPGGAVLIEKVASGTPTPPTPVSFAPGELVTTTTSVRVRRTPGLMNKPPDDTLGVFEPLTTLNILAGPQRVDGLDWWRVGGVLLPTGGVVGWVAEKDPTDMTLVARPPKLSGTNIPDRGSKLYLGAPFVGQVGISQLWGENPQIYSGITYDGVPLKGHNGIDFLTPSTTNILAVDDGVVAEAVPNDPSGFGNYIKLRHPWGESLYAHLESFNVQAGQSVRRGGLIARSDNTGFSNGPHLHFAIRRNGYNRQDGWGGFSDPLPYLNPASFPLPAVLLDQGMLSAAVAAPSRDMAVKPLAEAPGYAPDQPGMTRP